jgi:predicted transposase/invertase (TIGR01784 family)
MKLLTPKSDFIFKRLLTGDSGILTDLLNSVLGLPKDRRIRSVEVKNPIVLPEEITQKYIVLDILATDESGQSYEIEMQVRRYESYPKRALYYLSRIYAGQL